MTLQGPQTKALFERAKQTIPYGVNSNFRYWGNDNTLVIKRGQGAYIWDADDRRYIDYRLGFGPVILGHGYEPVVERVANAIKEGTIFAWTTPLEIEVAEQIKRLTGVDKVRLTNTGTEAVMHALRIARAYTGREKFISFEGHYHGMSDYFLFSTASAQRGTLGSRRSPIAARMSSGIPVDIRKYMFSVPFNDFELLESTVKARWSDLAAIVFEPVMGNSAGIMPEPGYLELIRELCDRYGIVMLMDEVKTGFRIANGGAQEYFGVRADLVTYAKSMGNGFPIAAIAGREQVMMSLEPGSVAHGGTYTGNIVGTAAANVTLSILESEPVIETINERGTRLMSGISDILTELSVPHVVTGLPPMFSISLGSEVPPKDFRDYLDGDTELYERIAMELIQRGVMPDSDGREPWFLCYALSEADVDETLNVFNDSARAALA
jgi:glutamate-1-semialdehyde 2,1-aminomutase